MILIMLYEKKHKSENVKHQLQPQTNYKFNHNINKTIEKKKSKY